MPFLPFEFPFQISLNLGFLQEWARLPFPLLLLEIFKNGGWLLFLLIFFRGFAMMWLVYRQGKWAATVKKVLLAIDVPKDNLQTPKAVENIFSTLAGAHGSVTFWEKWFKGEFQLSFSLELISIDGYVQFLIRTPVIFRDLVEAAIYAQYPDAEIIEVSDYTENVPAQFPDPEWKLWGTEYKLHEAEVYPLKTWEEFEHGLAEEGAFKDPMAAMLEVLSSLRVGEQVWLQIFILPITDDWKKGGEDLVQELIGAKKKVAPPGLIETIILGPFKLLGDIMGGLLGVPPAEPKKEREAPPSLVQYMSPGELDVVKGVQKKISKLGYKCKIRLLYIARKEVYSKPRGVAAPIGAIKQFNTLDLNQFRPDKKTWTNVYYFFVERRRALRQNKLLKGYRRRDGQIGGKLYVLNIEELASLWHFPVKEVKAPLLKKTEAKKGEPPVALPIERSIPLGLPAEVSLPMEVAPFAAAPAAPAGAVAAATSAGVQPGVKAVTEAYTKAAPPIGLPVTELSEQIPLEETTKGGAGEAGPPENLPIAK